MNLKDGWKTTEFWLTLLAQGVTLWSAVKGFVPPQYAVLISIGGGAIYTVARTILKAVSDYNATKAAQASVPPTIAPPPPVA